MKKCPECKKLVSDEEMYCPFCDTKLGKSSHQIESASNSTSGLNTAINPTRNNPAPRVIFNKKKQNAEKLISLYNILSVLYIIAMVVCGIAIMVIAVVISLSYNSMNVPSFAPVLLGIFLGLIATAIFEIIMYIGLYILKVQKLFYEDYCSLVNELELEKEKVKKISETSENN